MKTTLERLIRAGIFLELNFKRLYRSSEKEKESRRLVFTFSKKGGIKHFHVVVVH